MKANISLIWCVILSVGFIYLFIRIDKLKIPETQNVTTQVTQDVCGLDCKTQIADAISKLPTAIPVITLTPTPAVKTNKTAYLPLPGPITTPSINWVDALGTDFYLDLGADYSPSAVASWEATLQLSNSSDQVYARLYDVTHAIDVGGSEITLINTTSPVKVSSGNLSLWRGYNSYRVQFKSRSGTLVTVDNIKIKITY